MIPSQMLKGTLEGCIMAIISRQPTYGYEIAEQLKNYGFGQIAEGTIYPLLLRLEKNGLANAEYRASEIGPKRKYYALTAKGREELASFLASYRELTSAVDRLMDEMKGESTWANEPNSCAGRTTRRHSNCPSPPTARCFKSQNTSTMYASAATSVSAYGAT